MNKVWHVNIVALLIAVLPLPYVFYPGLRGLVCGSVLYLLFQMHSKKMFKTNNWLILFAGIAILYNPLFPVFLPKSAWVVINIVTAFIFYKHLQETGQGDEKNYVGSNPGSNQTTIHQQKITSNNLIPHDISIDELVEDDAVEYILALLLPQHILMGFSPPNLPSDDFSIGYVLGFVDESLRNYGISDEDVSAHAI